MRRHLVRVSAITAVLMIAAVRTAGAQVCVTVDAARDMLPPDDRKAAVLLLTTQFQMAGERVVTDNCLATYVVSHVRLGNTITVTLSGPAGHREGTALGLDDLPALYSQMVRAILTGRSVGSMGVVDRTNVTAAQDLPPRRVASDAFWYARLGYGALFSEDTHSLPGMGIGYRAEFDSFGVDVSFLNFAWGSSGVGSYVGSDYSSASAGSWLKLEALRFGNKQSNSTPYFGGGMSWGHTYAQSRQKNWNGDGLAGELTAGYEIGRASSVRFFVQGDATLPFYNTAATTYTYTRLPNGNINYSVQPKITSEQHYTPSLVVSFGIGWQKGRH